MKLSLVLVAYRSSAVIGAAVRSFLAECRAGGLAAEVIVVDHSEDEAERLQLAGLPATVMSRPNRGYAAGINFGVGLAQGDVVLVGNPDLAFEPGSLAALLAALDAGGDVVGPQFVLGELLLPPPDLQTPGQELWRWAASRWRTAWRLLLRREVARWLEAWRAQAPVAVAALNGALLAFRRTLFDNVGPWDEGYFLYFEETEWLRRARRRGFALSLVPGAHVTHLWAHSANTSECLEHFRRSHRRFFASEYGILGRVVAGLQVSATPLRPAPFRGDSTRFEEGEVLWLVSPSRLGMPAAGVVTDGRPPLTALETVRHQRGVGPGYTLLAVRPADGRMLGAWSWEPDGE